MTATKSAVLHLSDDMAVLRLSDYMAAFHHDGVFVHQRVLPTEYLKPWASLDLLGYFVGMGLWLSNSVESHDHVDPLSKVAG